MPAFGEDVYQRCPKEGPLRIGLLARGGMSRSVRQMTPAGMEQKDIEVTFPGKPVSALPGAVAAPASQ